MSQNIVIALGLYAIGALLRFFYELITFKKDNGESMMDFIHSNNDSQLSDKTIFSLTIIILFFSSFVWPISLITDIKNLFKKEVQN